MKIGEKIKLLRKSEGLTQKEFGNRFGISYQVVSDIELGKSKPSKTLIRFLEFRYNEKFSNEQAKSPRQEQKLPEGIHQYAQNKAVARCMAILEHTERFDIDTFINMLCYLEGMFAASRFKKKFSYPKHDPERRSGLDRRTGLERRINLIPEEGS